MSIYLIVSFYTSCNYCTVYRPRYIHCCTSHDDSDQGFDPFCSIHSLSVHAAVVGLLTRNFSVSQLLTRGLVMVVIGYFLI